MKRELEALHAALDECPGDQFLRKVLADLLEEQGGPLAAGYRWLAENGRRPQRYVESEPDERYVKKGWPPFTWRVYRLSKPSDPATIPGEVFDLIGDSLWLRTYYARPSIWHDFATRREADDEVAAAYERSLCKKT